MADRSKSLELKVGIFVFIGFVVLTWFVLWIGDFKLVRQGFTVKVTFSFVNGIKMGASVRLAGVDRGEVKDIKLTHDNEGKAKVTIIAWVDYGTEIPQDSRAWVNTLGLMGEKYLEIIPGKDYKNVLKENEVLKGEDPTSVQEVTDLTKDVVLQVKDTLSTLQLVLGDMHEGRGTIGKLFTDDKLYTDIEEMFADLKKHPWKLLYRPKDTR
jgi:phospholipid/cholesterol/gamma-HCH transport system substrate-binding protein